MKTLKINFFSLLILLGMFSCSQNQDEILDPTETANLEKSITAKIVAENVQTHVKSDGTFNNPTNPESSIKFDFGFNFVYPITLNYNNGTQVLVNGITDLAKVVSTITSTNYIEGIVFPFTVITNDTIQKTITNESEFEALIESHDTDHDTIPNYTDTDDDNDGALDTAEDANNDGDSTNDDADHDGDANYQDNDSDNDGVNDQNEDNDGDGNFTNDDSDNDGTPDYNDTDSDNDGTDDGTDTDDDNNGTSDNNEDHSNGSDNDNDNNDNDNNDNDGNDY